MAALIIRIRLRTAFATAPKGDTLFGQVCWALRHALGEPELVRLLDGYTDDQPFAVLSDLLPAGCWHRPALPASAFETPAGADRKLLKRRRWIARTVFDEPLQRWLAATGGTDVEPLQRETTTRAHNSLHRLLGTTHGGDFAPFETSVRELVQSEDGEAPPAELVAVLDTQRVDAATFTAALAHVGQFGFGRDASTGLGKFDVEGHEPLALPAQDGADGWLTLAPCAPQGGDWRDERCCYAPFTRFGRHGDIAVHGGNPFKAPVLLADSGAVLVPRQMQPREFIGRGLGGDGSLSRRIRATVQQGYAPVLGVRAPAIGAAQEASA